LRVLPAEPDYELTVAADRFTVVPGQPTTVAVKVNRLNGFKEPVEGVAEELPEGIKLETATPVKPDPATITLILTAERAGPAGVLRLAGRVKDGPRRVVRPVVPDFDELPLELWVTVAETAAPPPAKKNRK
jgi:hypothetical protein